MKHGGLFFSKYGHWKGNFPSLLSSQEREKLGSTKMADGSFAPPDGPAHMQIQQPFPSLSGSLSLYCFLLESKRPFTFLNAHRGCNPKGLGKLTVPTGSISVTDSPFLRHSFILFPVRTLPSSHSTTEPVLGHSNSKTNKTWDFIFAGHRGDGGQTIRKQETQQYILSVRNIKNYIHTV